MNSTIRNIQLVAALIVLAATVLAFILEIKEMYINQTVNLADLLLLFIYIEVIGLVRSYWETRSVRISYPLVIAITALARYIILQDKNDDPATLLYISLAILIVALSTVIIRFRNSKHLKIDQQKARDTLQIKALDYYKKSKDIKQKLKDDIGLAFTKLGEAKVNYWLGNYSISINLLNQCIKTAKDFKNNIEINNMRKLFFLH